MYMVDDRAAREWAFLLHAQHGIVAKAQARLAGHSAKAVQHQLRSGKWRYVRRGVYATFTGEVPREARLWAAIKRAGPGAMLSHETAAEIQRLADKPSAKISITVPAGCPGRPPRRLTTVPMLRVALAGRARIRWRAWLTDVLSDAADGVQSALERRYTRDVERAHGLPRAQHQARREIDRKIHFKDNWYPEFGLCVEIDGPSYHQDEQVGRDHRRDNLNLATDDIRTFRFGPVEVTELACGSAAMVAATLRRNGWQGTPHPCRRPTCALRGKTKTRDTLNPSGGSKYPT